VLSIDTETEIPNQALNHQLTSCKWINYLTYTKC
jgi:hypothetical protein